MIKPLSPRAYVYINHGDNRPRLFTSLKACKDYYELLPFYYDTPQFINQVENDCHYVLTQLNQGYNIINIDTRINAYAKNKDVKAYADKHGYYVIKRSK